VFRRYWNISLPRLTQAEPLEGSFVARWTSPPAVLAHGSSISPCPVPRANSGYKSYSPDSSRLSKEITHDRLAWSTGMVHWSLRKVFSVVISCILETKSEELLCLPTHLYSSIAISLKKPHIRHKLPLRKSPGIYHADFDVRWVAAKPTASPDHVLNYE